MTNEERKKIEANFAEIRAELDSSEGQAKAQVRVRREFRKEVDAHRAFLARSRERAFTRMVYR